MDDDDPQSPSPTRTRTQTPPPSSTAVTVAAPPHHQTLTLALPIQPAVNPNGGGGGSGSGREDCWSDGATSALIDAWGDRYLHLSRGNLKQHHWQEVADAVSARDDYTKPPKSDAQCKNRIDTLKKKYKSEKSKISSGQSQSSTWPFFHRLDILIGPTLLKAPPPSRPPAAPPAFPPQFPQKTRTQTVIKKRSRSPVSSDSEGSGWKELTKAMARFGEVYERVERAKANQAVEMEKQRMGFVRELELQRMQFFVKTQMELSQLKKRRSHKGSGGDRDHHRRNHRTADNGNGDGNNSDE